MKVNSQGAEAHVTLVERFYV